ncbi:MAG TPA: LysR substrate-binding domain-containing protein [Candidatus Acidoferrum sp.]|jgi:DNA-binding transcriptional LysR family regulator
MELRHLRYFVAVAELLSFSRAAVKLRHAQPSLSTQIRDLENELGFRLLDRGHNRVTLTEAGAVFLRESKQVLASAETAIRLGREAAVGRPGELRLAAINMATVSFLPTCLSLFRAAVAGTRVTVAEIEASEVIDKLVRGELHAGFLSAPLPRLAGVKQLKFVKILRSPLIVLIASEHPFARRSSARLKDLVEEPFLHIRRNGQEIHRNWTQEFCFKVGATARFGAAASNLDNLISMVAAGEGVALIPKSILRGSKPGCAYIPIADKNLRHELFVVSNPHFHSDLVERFLEIVIAEAAAVEQRLQTPRKSQS